MNEIKCDHNACQEREKILRAEAANAYRRGVEDTARAVCSLCDDATGRFNRVAMYDVEYESWMHQATREARIRAPCNAGRIHALLPPGGEVNP